MQVYHFHNGGEGGVLSVIKNLIRFSSNSSIENHIIYAVNSKDIPEYKIEAIEGAVTQQLYHYDPKNNFYYTCRQLAKLLPNNKAVIIAHDWVELGMVSNLGLQNPVVQFLHGNYPYYYDLAEKNDRAVNLFIAVCDTISVHLKQKMPKRSSDIVYLRFPVPDANAEHRLIETDKKIIFVGRLTEGKGYDLLPKIAKELNKIDTGFSWHIVGQSNNSNKNKIAWPENVKVHFYGNIENEKVQELLPKMTFFVLPSKAEGMPVSLIEAMKAGVVPIINNLEGGIDELIKNGINGFKIDNNEVDEYVSKLFWCASNRATLKHISSSTKQYAEQLFNPQINTAAIESEIVKMTLSKKLRIPQKVYGSKLDQPWISNKIVLFLRAVLR